jgi:hypothetical protein
MKSSFLAFLLLPFILLQLSSQVPQELSFQSLMKNADGTSLSDGEYSFTFRIYNSESGGSAIWSETQTLQATNGYISAVLGLSSTLNLSFEEQYWIGISIEGESELTPRIALTSSPYSFVAKTVEDGAITVEKINQMGAVEGEALIWNGTAWEPQNVLLDETDPIYSADPASGITGSDITNWDEAHGWGDHAEAGYIENGDAAGGDLTGTYPNPIIANGAVQGDDIDQMSATTGQVLKWNGSQWAPGVDVGGGSGDDWGDQVVQTDASLSGTGIIGNELTLAQQGATNGQVLTWDGSAWGPDDIAAGDETDPIFSASPSSSITNTNITNWNTAYGWGDHSAAGYLSSYTETDPIFSASPSNGITNTNISNWNTAYGWGDHSTEGYLTSESDPIYLASPSSGISNTNISNWNTAYGWGDHAIAGYMENGDAAGGDLTGFYPNPELEDNSVDSDIIADGTLSLSDFAQNGASSGETFIWDGSAWTTGNVSSLELPYNETVNSASAPAFQITQTNANHSAIRGTNSNHNYLGELGYSGWGLWEAPAGVYGENTDGTSCGVLASQLDGVFGYSNQSGGYSVYGQSGISAKGGIYGVCYNTTTPSSSNYQTCYAGTLGRHSSGNYGFLGNANNGVYGQNVNGHYGAIGTSTYGIVGYHNSGHWGAFGGSGFGTTGTYGSNYGYLGTPFSGAEGTSTSGYGVYGEYGNGTSGVSSDDYIGMLGYTGDQTATNKAGVYGEDKTTTNYGALGTTGFGVYGRHGNGNYGHVGSTNYGVYGYHGNGNYGALGNALDGAFCISISTGGYGVYSSGGSSTRGGIYGICYNTAIPNYSSYTSCYAGILGNNISGNFGFLGNEDFGAYGRNSNDNYGYFGGSSYGAYGSHSTGNYGYIGSPIVGIYGYSNTTSGDYDYGIYGGGGSNSNGGVYGFCSNNTTPTSSSSTTCYAGVIGRQTSGNYGFLGNKSYGVYGRYEDGSSDNYGWIGSSNFAVYGYATETGEYAGYFYQDVYIVDDCSADDFINLSDSRLKDNQKPIEYGLKEILRLRPKSYFVHLAELDEEDGSFNILDEGENDIGLIAQEVYDILPEVVFKPEDESKALWGINYGSIVPVLVKAIQEQQEMIEELNKKDDEIQVLKQKVEEQNQRIEALEKLNERIDCLEKLLKVTNAKDLEVGQK